MARRADVGNAGNGFHSMSSGRTDLKTAWSGWCVRMIVSLLTGQECVMATIDRVEGGVAPPPPTPPDMRATHPAVHQANRSRRHRALMLCKPRASQYRLFRVRQSGGEPDMRQGPFPLPAQRRAS